MTEQKSPYRMLVAALAVAAGCLEANPFADAVGIPPFDHDPGYLSCGSFAAVWSPS